MCEYEIRKATPQDAAQMAELYDAVIRQMNRETDKPWWFLGWYPCRETVDAGIAAGEYYVWLEDGALAGAMVLNHRQDKAYRTLGWERLPEEQVLVIHTLATHPQFRGRNGARKMIAFAERLAKERGCAAVRFDTIAENQSAQHVYESCGYRMAGTVDLGIDRLPGRDFYCYEKRL